ncbi:MAG TPA: methyltransferase domain-containing protein [Stellaceae bacterium]|jgi:SAM-dependent methyltransferase|nr:methyltransferase domain-containing protein [Stellaceae bacterium]
MGEDGILTPFQMADLSAADSVFEPLFVPESPFARIDGAAIASVTNLYREVLPSGGAILDVMSGWVSHLPPEALYRRVVGIGIEGEALAENPFLDDFRVQDLNANPILPFPTGEFDGATICAAIQHLARPGEVIREIARVLRPGAPLIISFSNRCVATKPIACWCLLDETGHLCLLAQHFAEAGNWADIRCLDRTPAGGGQPLYAVIGRSLGATPPGDSD